MKVYLRVYHSQTQRDQVSCQPSDDDWFVDFDEWSLVDESNSHDGLDLEERKPVEVRVKRC